MADEPDLYGLPLEEFITARDAAARALRKAGERETAAQVAKLPKPSPAAWAANQVAREQPELIAALLDAGAALRAAQDAAMSGAAAGLRDATLAERRAVDAVMDVAAALRPAGKPLSRAMADRLRTTLHAAAGDPAVRDALAAGRLVSEAQAGGAWPFSMGAADEPAPPPPKKKPPADEDARREAEERAAAAREALQAQLREARGSLRVRERVASAAAEDAEAAERAVAEARQALEEAQAEAEAAVRVRDEAQAALEQARDDVARLEERLD